MDRRTNNAFTLVEVLACVGIIAVLGGISFAAYGRSRAAGWITRDTSNLRQWGVARSLYVADYDDKIKVRGLDPLLSRVKLTPDFASSPFDPYPDGLANRVRRESELPPYPVSQRISYVSLFDVQGLSQRDFPENVGASGWLIAIREPLDNPGSRPGATSGFQGHYSRLTDDGAVIVRPFHRFVTKDNGIGLHIDFFHDER